MDSVDMTLTRSGGHVNFTDPSQTKILWIDIDYYLQHLNRYNGGIDWPLLNHLVLGVLVMQAYGYDVTAQRYFGLHDMHEIIAQDIVTGLKRKLGNVYRDIECSWEEHFHSAFLMPMPFTVYAGQVKEIDLLCLLIETDGAAPQPHNTFKTILQPHIVQFYTDNHQELSLLRDAVKLATPSAKLALLHELLGEPVND